MLTRRHFLAATALAGAAGLARSRPAQAAFETPLPIPRLIDASANGNKVSLSVAPGRHAYFPGETVDSFGISAPVLAPVIRLARGADTDITVDNRSGRATTVHWHGLIVPGEVDGGPHSLIAPGEQWKISLPVDQPETTAWFHAHPHGETASQVYSGLAGMLIIDEGIGENLGLPHAYGVDDLPLVLQDRYFDRSGAPVYNPRPIDIMTGYRGDAFIVNGVVSPVARVPAGMVRLRLLNGANARFFDLRFSDGRSFQVIASDGGYLAAPVRLQSLLIAPGERYEVLVDFSDGAAVVLETDTDPNVPAMGMGGGASFAAGGDIMRFAVDPAMQADVSTAPGKLVDVPKLDRSAIVETRQFILNDMMMGGMMGGMGGRRGRGPVLGINGEAFAMDRIDAETRRGTMELWQIGSHMMAHPFHVHGTQFQILSMNGQPPPPQMSGWKDTVLVAGTAEILVPFNQTAARDHPYMFHCHILEHEDAGMMGQFTCS